MNKHILIAIIITLLAFIIIDSRRVKDDGMNVKNTNIETLEVLEKTESSTDVSMFPVSTDDMVQTVIHLDPQENELQDYKVELYAEKTEIVDCNTRSFAGEFKDVNLDGWGYTYYEFESNGLTISTLMGCPEGSDKEGIVKSQSIMTRYNSKLPLVIYASPEYTIKHRIWSPDN